MSGVYNSKYTGEQIDAMLHNKEVQNISDTQTIYIAYTPTTDEERTRVLPTLTAGQQGTRYMAQMEQGSTNAHKIGVYDWWPNATNTAYEWRFLFQLTGSTLYIGLDTRLIYQYRSSAPYLRPLTPYSGTYKVSNSQGVPFYLKISNFGDWGSNANYANVNISMLITSRTNEAIFVNIASNDGKLSIIARKLSGTVADFQKISSIYYNVLSKTNSTDTLESALYLMMGGYSNVLCAHILSTTHAMYQPMIEVVSALPATKTDGTGLQSVPIINVGAGSNNALYFGSFGASMTFYGSGDRPKYVYQVLNEDGKTYSTVERTLATTNDIPTVPTLPSMKTEEWKFTVEGSNTPVTKKVYVVPEA
jgi:hypothetical protein